ncbi:NAD-dependent epimerase/dehydratase family protein [Rhizobium sp. S153]|uniref:NAD-dependent epimerase/dehydratase family protein n=1 Tax=Ciceribacter sichuanensis TaxID=2949647 RepID=A0ABT0V836_9HYPH|nr:NAD-dependent epimerase/dehydratase family protein [Ciceribacter sp. S153]MCM2401944.1 NAD-dependent epimerase/dehydratase family protein [Ciceribacter sp. S153]
MARALVTGGAGFVGRHICSRLLKEGVDVVCIDALVGGTGALRPERWPVPPKGSFTFVQQDCREYFARSTERFDYVYHLAAMVGGRVMLETQTLCVAEDLSIDAQMWKWAAETKPGCVVFFSSSAAYPIGLQGPSGHKLLSEGMISFENDIGVPDLSYGWAKLTGEFLMKLYVERYGGRAIAYRPFSGYGEDQDLAYPFPAICRRLMGERGQDEVYVWGSGRQCRDFIHISDCVDFIWRTVDRLPSGASLNLSTGVATSFIALAEEVARQIGWEPKISGLSDKPEGVFFRCGDTELQSDYGLSPSIDLGQGIAHMLEHLRFAAGRAA